MVIVPIFKNDAEKEKVMPVVNKVRAELTVDVWVKVDEREETWLQVQRLGDAVCHCVIEGALKMWRRAAWQWRGDIPGREGKSFVPQNGIADTVKAMLITIHKAL